MTSSLVMEGILAHRFKQLQCRVNCINGTPCGLSRAEYMAVPAAERDDPWDPIVDEETGEELFQCHGSLSCGKCLTRGARALPGVSSSNQSELPVVPREARAQTREQAEEEDLQQQSRSRRHHHLAHGKRDAKSTTSVRRDR